MNEEELKKEFKYLDDKEFFELNEFGGDGGFLQYTLGIGSCKTKGDVVELLKEIFQKGYTLATEDVLKKIDELINECMRNPPLSEYWVGKEVALEQIKASLKNSQQTEDCIKGGSLRPVPDTRIIGVSADTNNQDVCEKDTEGIDMYSFNEVQRLLKETGLSENLQKKFYDLLPDKPKASLKNSQEKKDE